MKQAVQAPNPFVRAVGAPARVANRVSQSTLAGTRRQVSRLCWAILIGLIAWDLYLEGDATPDNTWSEVMRGASGRYPVLPWLLGLLLGHLFHPQDSPEPVVDREAAASVLAVGTFAFIGLGFASVAWPVWWAGALALVGLFAASLLWPMERRTEDWRW